ncbi:uncharacterized protein ACMZJ9_015166 [Mantella aurantiaca]
MNPITSNIHHRTDQLERSMNPSNPEESSDTSHTVTAEIHLTSQSTERSTDPSNPKESSIKHERDHTGESSISCLGCGKSFTMRSELLIHLRSHTRVTYSCSECEKSFTEESEYLEHEKTHNPYSCSQCGKSFTLKGEFKTHQKSHTADGHFAGNRKTSEGDFILSPEDNDITQYSPEEKPFPHNIKHEGDRTRKSRKRTSLCMS